MAVRSDILGYSVDELSDFLEVKGIGEDILSILRENRVGGETFLDLNESDLRELIKPLGERKVLMRLIDSYKPSPTAIVAKQAGPETVSRNWAQNFEIPRQFSRKTMHAIEHGEITRCCRTEIVTALAFQIYTKYTRYPTSEEYTTVCNNLVKQYPVLKDTIGNGIGSWKLQLRTKMKNMRRDPEKKRPREESGGEKENEDPVEENPRKKPAQQNHRAGSSVGEDVDSRQYEVNVQHLSDELAKEKPSRKTVRSLMKETFRGRRRWILTDSPPVMEVIVVFPPMKQAKYLHRELQAVAETEIEFNLQDAADVWHALQPKIEKLSTLEAQNSMKLQQLLQHQNSEASSLTTDDSGEALLSLHALEQLAHLLAPRTKMQLVYRFPMQCDIQEEVKKLGHVFPYIVVLVGDSAVQFVIIVEQLILADSENFIDALLALIGTYFAFNIAYPRQLYPLCIFIQHFIMKIVDKQKVPAVVTRTLSSIDTLV